MIISMLVWKQKKREDVDSQGIGVAGWGERTDEHLGRIRYLIASPVTIIFLFQFFCPRWFN